MAEKNNENYIKEEKQSGRQEYEAVFHQIFIWLDYPILVIAAKRLCWSN